MFRANRPGISQFFGLSVMLLAAGLGNGCMDDRAPYMEPKGPPARLATLKGGWGYYITEMDGDRVDSGNIRLSYFGGNGLKLTPGDHEFRACFAGSGSNDSGDSGGLNGEITLPHKWLVRYQFQPGHTYQLGPYNFVNTTLTITDVDTTEFKCFDSDDDVDRRD
jgi:hypothetical protein